MKMEVDGPPPHNDAASQEENIQAVHQWFIKKCPAWAKTKLARHENLAVRWVHPVKFPRATDVTEIITKGLVWLDTQHIQTIEMRMPWVIEKIQAFLATLPKKKTIQEQRESDESLRNQCIECLKPLMKEGSPGRIFEFLAPKNLPGDFLRVDTAERKRHELAKVIFDHHRQLKNMWAAYQEPINKRWKDKSGKKRQKILTDAWPEINIKPWMALEAWLKEKNREIKGAALYWPGINLEDWSKKELFLKFLQMRIDHPPDYFLWVDQSTWQFAHEIGEIRIPYLYGFVMEFRGQGAAEDYGKVIPLEADSKKDGRSMTVGHGITTMEAQAHIYKTLLACCMNLLNNEEKANLTGQGSNPELSTSSEKGIESGSSEFSTLPIAITDQVCQLPGRPNLDSLLERVEARLESAKDHLWALREDPGHFRATLADFRSHETEYWKAFMEKLVPGGAWTEAQNECRVLSRTITAAFDAVLAWEAVKTYLQAIRQLMDREEMRHIGHRDEIPLDLHAECYGAFEILKWWVSRWAESLHGHLMHSPLIRDRREKRQEMIEKNKQKSQRRKKKEKQTKTEEQLQKELDLEQKYQHVLAIAKAADKPTIPPLEMFRVLIDHLDAQLKEDEVMRQHVTSFVQRDISHLSLLLEFRAHLRLLPWAPTLQTKRRTGSEQVPNQFLKQVKGYAQAIDPFTRFDWKKAGAFVTEEDLEYPVEEIRTREIVKRLQKAESVLDKFWKAVDDNMKERETAWPPCLEEILKRSPERTADWVQPEVSGHKRARTETSETVSQRPSKKAKRRGIADPARAQPPQEEMQAEPGEQERIYEVDQRALVVFDFLFFQPGRSGHPGEIRWSEFVRALNAIEFRHEQGGGSSMFFTAPDHLRKKGGERIHFHAPHDGGLYFELARFIGNRLRNRYGLHHGVFRLKK